MPPSASFWRHAAFAASQEQLFRLQPSLRHLSQAYTQWADANQEEAPMKNVAFGQALSERGVGSKHGRAGSLRLGLALKAGDYHY
jgi:phage/plasmid-associated DNA primase